MWSLDDGLRRLGGLVSVMLLCLVAGCALVEMDQRNKGLEASNAKTEADLAREEQKRAALAAEQQALMRDLKSREMSIGALQQRLDRMLELNRSAGVNNAEQARQRDELNRKLADAKAKAQTLDRDNTLSQQDKQKRLNDLKAELERLLQAGAR